MWGELVSTGQPRLELKWYHLNIFHSCLGWPRSGGNIYTYIGVITPDITSSFVTHYFHSREYVKLNNGVGRNILACFNPFYLPFQFLHFETLMLVRLDRFSSDVVTSQSHLFQFWIGIHYWWFDGSTILFLAFVHEYHLFIWLQWMVWAAIWVNPNNSN